MNIHKLTPLKINRLIQGRKFGKHSDGGCLYLRIAEGADGSVLTSWFVRIYRNGRESQIDFGDSSLTTAREMAKKARIDLWEERAHERAELHGTGAYALINQPKEILR
jgi:hypothetical protein